jgi:hypothetical protein
MLAMHGIDFHSNNLLFCQGGLVQSRQPKFGHDQWFEKMNIHLFQLVFKTVQLHSNSTSYFYIPTNRTKSELYLNF